jgi:hypothetical protein
VKIGFYINDTGQQVRAGIVEVVAAAIFKLRTLGFAGLVERVGGHILVAIIALADIIELIFVCFD